MAKQYSMNVSLTPQLAKQVADRVKSGDYASASEVVRAALRTLSTAEKRRDAQLRELRRSIREADAAIDRGEGIPADVVFAKLRAKSRGRRRAAA